MRVTQSPHSYPFWRQIFHRHPYLLRCFHRVWRSASPPSQSCAALPANFHRLRLDRGWSIASLAAESGVSASTIRDLETGWGRDRSGGDAIRPNPTLSVLLALAHALNVGIEELVGER